MIVCLCNAVSDSDIRRQVAAGVRDFAALQAATACSTCCGCCEPMAREVLAEALEVRPARARAMPLPVLQPVAA